MKLRIVAVGRLKSGPEREIAERYRGRLRAVGRTIGIGKIEQFEIPESRAGQGSARKQEEGEALKARVEGCTTVVAFDERGEHLTSRGFADLIENAAQAAGGGMAVLIGGPDGFDTAVRSRADRVVSFGRLTLPHQLVRVLVLEQLYRAATILAGHPYHRD